MRIPPELSCVQSDCFVVRLHYFTFPVFIFGSLRPRETMPLNAVAHDPSRFLLMIAPLVILERSGFAILRGEVFVNSNESTIHMQFSS